MNGYAKLSHRILWPKTLTRTPKLYFILTQTTYWDFAKFWTQYWETAYTSCRLCYIHCIAQSCFKLLQCGTANASRQSFIILRISRTIGFFWKVYKIVFLLIDIDNWQKMILDTCLYANQILRFQLLHQNHWFHIWIFEDTLAIILNLN